MIIKAANHPEARAGQSIVLPPLLAKVIEDMAAAVIDVVAVAVEAIIAVAVIMTVTVRLTIVQPNEIVEDTKTVVGATKWNLHPKKRKNLLARLGSKGRWKG